VSCWIHLGWKEWYAAGMGSSRSPESQGREAGWQLVGCGCEWVGLVQGIDSCDQTRQGRVVGHYLSTALCTVCQTNNSMLDCSVTWQPVLTRCMGQN